MQIRRTTGFIVLSLVTAFFLSACGGGGGGDSPAPNPKPLANTTAATNPTSTGITLNAVVNPKGLATTAWFEYSKDPALASNVIATVHQSMGSGTVNIDNVTQAITGLDPGATYSYRVVANNSEGTTQGTIYTFSTLPLPTATTIDAGTILTTGANLNATVNPNGRATYAWFEYGLTSSLGTVVDNQLRGSGTGNVTISFPLSPLSVATRYYFRVVASNSAGTTQGTILSFITAGGVPSVLTKDPTSGSITATGATLNADVNASGLATYAWFQYGLTTSFGSILDNQSRGSGTNTVSFDSPLTGLAEHTKYYYRIVANNSVGTANGDTLNFTTSYNPPPSAVSHFNETVWMAGPYGAAIEDYGPTTVTMDASASNDPYGTITSYQWTQTNGWNTPVLSNPGPSLAAVNTTFTAPQFVYGATDNLAYLLTVTDNRGLSGTDNIWKYIKWGFFDDFSTDSTGKYGVYGGGTFTYESSGQRARAVAGAGTTVKFQKFLPETGTGVFTLNFNPTSSAGTDNIVIRLADAVGTYYELSLSTRGDSTGKKVWHGGQIDAEVNSVAFPFSYSQGGSYSIKITFSPENVTFEASGGVKVDLNPTNTNSINSTWFEIETTEQTAFYDNIKLEAAP